MYRYILVCGCQNYEAAWRAQSQVVGGVEPLNFEATEEMALFGVRGCMRFYNPLDGFRIQIGFLDSRRFAKMDF